MTATITNGIIERFVTCKQKTYLELVGRSEVPTHFELHLKTITTHMREEFRQSIKYATISAYFPHISC